MTPDGWDMIESQDGETYEIQFWEEGKITLNFSVTAEQARELGEALADWLL